MSTLPPRSRRLSTHRPTKADRAAAATMMEACRAAETTLKLAAERSRDGSVSVAARGAASFLCSIRVAVAARVATGSAPLPLHDRLRLEWLASSFLPGRADARLLDEAARLLREAVASIPSSELLGDEMDRLRVASVEAWSLAHALASVAEPDLLFATG